MIFVHVLVKDSSTTQKNAISNEKREELATYFTNILSQKCNFNVK